MEYIRDEYHPINRVECERYWKILNEAYKIQHGGVFYTSFFARYEVVKNLKGEWVTSIQKGPEKTFLNKLVDIAGSKEIALVVIEYIRVEKTLYAPPHIQKRAYLFDENGVKRRSGWKGEIYFDGENYQEHLPFPEIRSNEFINEIDDILLGIFETQERKELFMRYMGQFAFENRLEARPVLICWDNDVEGTGKTLLHDMFLKPVFPTYSKVQSDLVDDSFNGHREAKLIFIEEAERGYLQTKQKNAKEMSGSLSVQINKKGIPRYDIEVTNYPYYAANKIPLSISAEPISDLENRWLVFKFVNKLANHKIAGPIIKKYQNSGKTFIHETIEVYNQNTKKKELRIKKTPTLKLRKMFEENFGAWLKEILLPFHLKQQPIGRYGFRIPKTYDMYPLLDAGKDVNIVGVFDTLDTLYRMDLDNENIVTHNDPNMQGLVRIFQEEGWFSSKLMSIKGIEKTTPKKFKMALAIMDIKKGEKKSFRLPGVVNPYSGTRVDLKKFLKFFEETPEEKKQREKMEDLEIFGEIN